MNKKTVRLLIVPLVVAGIYFIVQAFLLINDFGFFSIVEEIPLHFKKTNQQTVHLLKGQKASASFKAKENNLGIVLIQLIKFGQGRDRITFRIKQEGEQAWYHESNIFGGQVQNDQRFPLGFPPIANSKNNVYVFELESLAGSYSNGIGVIKDKPARLMYKYSPSSGSIVSFITKKLIDVFKNINYLQITAIFVISYFIILLMKRPKLLSIIRRIFLLKDKNYYRKFYKWFSNNLKPSSLLLKKKTKTPILTKIYLFLHNNNWEMRLIISLLIFFLALTYRFSSALVNQSNLFYAGLGGGGDYDQFIRAATCAVRNFCSAILGQNFLIESSILGAFYATFGFTGGLKAYLYLMIILSSIVATLPYLLLSKKNWISVGGIIGSLFLAASDYLIHMSLALPPDNGSLFTFSMFYAVYFLTLQKGTVRWLLFFGLMGAIDGLNKLILLLNNLAALLFFIPVFFCEKVKKIKQFPFVKLSPKLIFYSILPFLIFLVIYSAWEYIVQIKFSQSYYLRGLIDGNSIFISSTDVASVSFKESLSKGNILEIMYYYAGSSIVMLRRTIVYANLNTVLLAPIFIGLLFSTFRKPKFFVKKLISVAIFSAVVFMILALFRNNYANIQEIGQYVYAWPNDIYINIFLFTTIIFLFILNFKYQAFKLALPIIPYAIMLIILTKNAPWERMWVHVVVWSIILFAFLIDWILSNSNKNYILKKLRIGSILLILFIFFYTIPKTANMITQLYSGINNSRNEVKYLKWVNSELPDNAILLAGGKSDLVKIAENIKKPIVYNTLWTGALLIKQKEIPGVKPSDFVILNQLKINEIPGVKPSDWNIIDELKNKDNFKINKYLILEDDIYLWRNRIAGVDDGLFSSVSNTLLNPKNHSIKVYKFNSTLNKAIYELNLKDKI